VVVLVLVAVKDKEEENVECVFRQVKNIYFNLLKRSQK
jgi:hypothetical protein